MARQRKWVGGYVDKASGYYYIRRQVGGNRVNFSTRCKTLDGAVAELKRWESDPGNYVSGGTLAAPVRAGFAESVTAYLDYSEHVRGNTEKHVNAQAGCFDHLSSFLSRHGVENLMQVTPALVDAYISWRRQGGVTGKVVGAYSVALDIAALKGMFTWASRSSDQGGFLLVNPLEKYRIPKRPVDSGKVRTFTMEWWQKVRLALPDRYRMSGDVLLGSSMRWSSLARLHRDDIDIEAGVIRLPGNAIKGKEGTTVYVSKNVAEIAAKLAMMNLNPDSSAMNAELRKACQGAGVPYLSVHCFRHSAASMAIEDGVSGIELQKRLAHARFATTERYLHRLGGSEGAYRGRI